MQDGQKQDVDARLAILLCASRCKNESGLLARMQGRNGSMVRYLFFWPGSRQLGVTGGGGPLDDGLYRVPPGCTLFWLVKQEYSPIRVCRMCEERNGNTTKHKTLLLCFWSNYEVYIFLSKQSFPRLLKTSC